MSPLHDAVFCGRVDVAKLLVGFGGDPQLKDYTGRTAKDLAKGEAVSLGYQMNDN